MVTIIVILGVLAVGALLADAFGVFCVLILAFFAALIYNDANSPEGQARKKQRELEYQRAATPHVIRQADGCKVYAFTTDREHYFTRCGSTVTTETNWLKSCGKNCTKQESDTIVTEGNK